MFPASQSQQEAGQILPSNLPLPCFLSLFLLGPLPSALPHVTHKVAASAAGPAWFPWFSLQVNN